LFHLRDRITAQTNENIGYVGKLLLHVRYTVRQSLSLSPSKSQVLQLSLSPKSTVAN